MIYFLSDAHLGSRLISNPEEHQRRLVNCLREMSTDAEQIFLLGDIFDFWFTYRYLVPRGHTRLLGKLAELADSGVEIHFFIGNHDMWMFDYLTQEFGAILHDDPEVFELYGKRILIGHGDGLGHTDRWFDFVRVLFRSRLCQKLFKMLPSALTFGIAHRWSDNNKRKHARNKVASYRGDDREGIAVYCLRRMQTEHFDYCVFGHRHTPLVRPLGHAVYVNTGDWLEHRSYAVLTPDGNMSLLDDTHTA
jgi:UDP-2,3-diacylglucosamine hydrolase